MLSGTIPQPAMKREDYVRTNLGSETCRYIDVGDLHHHVLLFDLALGDHGFGFSGN